MTRPSPQHPDQPHGRPRRLAEALKTYVQKAASATVSTIKRLVVKHRNCMHDNRNYRQALLTGTTAIVSAMTLDPVMAAVVTAVVAIYVAAFQDGDERGPSGWRPDDPYRSW
jgi:hypothetical protein